LSHGGVCHHHREILQALRSGATDEAVRALRQEIAGATALPLQHLQLTDTPKFHCGLSTLLSVKHQ